MHVITESCSMYANAIIFAVAQGKVMTSVVAGRCIIPVGWEYLSLAVFVSDDGVCYWSL